MRARKGFLSVLMGVMFLAIISNTVLLVNATKNLTELNGIAGGQTTLNKMTYSMLGNISSKIHKPDFDKLIDGTVVIYHEGATAAGVCIDRDENYTYVLTVNHIVNRPKRPRGLRLIAPESNMGNIVNLETINRFLRSNTNEIDSVKYPNVKIVLHNYDSFVAEVIKIDSYYDLALLRISQNIMTNTLKISEMDTNVGDDVYVCGHPLGVHYNITAGIVSNLHDDNLMVVDASITFGNSGGGVYNQYGELIGICSSVPVYFNFNVFEKDEDDTYHIR